MTQNQDHPMSAEEFGAIAGFAKEQFGLNLKEEKMQLVQSRLRKRLAATRAPSYTQYLADLRANADPAENERFCEALTTNVTSFFREPHHFAHLGQWLKDRAAASGAQDPVRIWSAGCSKGAEPYSIAMCASDILPDAQKQVRILATDIDKTVLAHTSRATYSDEEIKGVSAERLQKYCIAQESAYKIRDSLRNMVSVNPLNLIADWPMRKRFDAIFCRNVAIYFDAPVQKRLWSRMADILKPGGYLYIGHSERVEGIDAFRTVGTTTYQKRETLS